MFPRKNPNQYTGLHIHWHEQWSQFFEACNWYTFEFFHIEVEWEKMMGGYELTFTLLGLGFRARYNYEVTEVVEDIIMAVDDLTEEINRGKS